MNNLQRLIASYLADNPGESYASIGRRGGLTRQTVRHVATTPKTKQTPQPKTIQGLALGLGYPESVIRAAAADSAGYGRESTEEDDAEVQIITDQFKTLDRERREVIKRRLRFLMGEMREEHDSGGRVDLGE